MLASSVIVFREIFEMALIICVIMAATKGLQKRIRYVCLGIMAGIVGSIIVAILASTVTAFAANMGKAVFNATILFLAAFLIGLSVIWMKRHAKTLTIHIRGVSDDVMAGRLPMLSLATVVCFAVLREGSEIVLFLHGIAATGDSNPLSMFLGSMLGLVAGVGLGWLMYVGMVRIPVKHLFNFTSVMLAFVAAGMAAKAAGKLVAGGLLPALSSPIWDTSAILPKSSVLGELFSVLLGYQERPVVMQVLFYLATLMVILLTPVLLDRNNRVNETIN